MLVLIGFQAIDRRLNPPPPPDVVAEADGEQAAPGDAEVAPDAAAQPARDRDAADDGVAGAADRSGLSADEADSAQDAEIAANAEFDVVDDQRAEAEPAWVTLGSLDENGPEKMLVWFNNRGAAIECIALNDARYTDLDDYHGYLGYLALSDTPAGVRIGAVGAGTPAARAEPLKESAGTGLRAGDLLEKFNDQPITSRAQFQALMEQTQPNQSVEVTVRRRVGNEDSLHQYGAILTRRPLEVIRPEPRDAAKRSQEHPYSYLLTLSQVGTKTADPYANETLADLPKLDEVHWEVRAIEDAAQPTIEFHYVLTTADLQGTGVAGPLRVIKRFRLPTVAPDESAAPGFHLDYEIEFRNEATSGDPVRLAYQQNGPTGLPLEGWWYTYKTHPTHFGGAGVRDVVLKAAGGSHKMFTNPNVLERLEEYPNTPLLPMVPDGDLYRLQYVGVDAQYFASAILRVDAAEGDANAKDTENASDPYTFANAFALTAGPLDEVRQSRTDVTFRLVSLPQEIGPQQSYRQQFRIFAGPKHPEVLAHYNMGEVITYGWFRIVAKPLTWVLHAIYSVTRNYGIAIILLTVLVRGSMYPLGMQQARNAQKMQELAPEMRKIADKYKNDLEKRTAAQQELFRKHKYNPAAGCLPMLVQLPIFVGLYRALSVDIELRQAALIPGLRWCSNLAGPDQFLYWENWAILPDFLVSRTGFLGPYLNILPLVSVAFMMIHQKMFMPPPTDEQQEIQQKVMKFMMLFFAFMFFKVPAGLCLYFITSSAWGLAERKLLPKPKAGGGTSDAVPAPTTPAPSRPVGNGSSKKESRPRHKSKRK